jgi:7-cyano-7-deazaguanine synthase in queuosine biosynthesis
LVIDQFFGTSEWNSTGVPFGASGPHVISTRQTLSQVSDTSLTSPAKALAMKPGANMQANIPGRNLVFFSIAVSFEKKSSRTPFHSRCLIGGAHAAKC